MSLRRILPLFGMNVALLAVWAIAAVLPCRADAENPEGQGRAVRSAPGRFRVQDLEFGYEFEYPGEFRFRKFPSLPGGGFMPAGLGDIDPRGREVIFVEVHRDWEQARDLETFLRNDAVASCAADGPLGSRSCPPESVRLERFRNAMEEDGFRIRRKKLQEHFADNGATIAEETEDLLVAYEVKRLEPAGAVVFFAEEPRWTGKMLEIAGTFRRLPQTR